MNEPYENFNSRQTIKALESNESNNYQIVGSNNQSMRGKERRLTDKHQRVSKEDEFVMHQQIAERYSVPNAKAEEAENFYRMQQQ